MLVLAASVVSCAEKPVLPDDAAGSRGKARLGVSLIVPADSRSATGEDGTTDGGTEAGTDAENRVSTALIVLGRISPGAMTPSVVHGFYEIGRFYPTAEDDAWWCELDVEPGRYRVVVIANPGSLVDRTLLVPGTPWSEVAALAARPADYAAMENMWKEGAFLMSNAYRGRVNDLDVELIRGERSEVTVALQRACARFDYALKNKGNAYPVTAYLDGAAVPASVTVHLTHAGLMNVGRNFLLFKHVSPDDVGLAATFYAYETSTNYVYDADWAAKRAVAAGQTDALDGLFFYGSETPSPELAYKELPLAAEYTPLFYCPENTIPGLARQIQMLSTAVVFKGWFGVDGLDPATTILYADADYIYTTEQKLTEVYPALSAVSSDGELAAAGVRRFVYDAAAGGFPVWYTYWNRHNDNGHPMQMGIMEFGVVRNNVYRLQVNGISALGLPQGPGTGNPWQPAGGTPDEEGPLLDVKVTVGPWTERYYDDEI